MMTETKAIIKISSNIFSQPLNLNFILWIKNVKKRRKELKLTQEEFSKKSGVSFGSIKRFENTGEISLFSLIKIAIVLECEDEFLNLFQQKQYNSIEEIINEQD